MNLGQGVPDLYVQRALATGDMGFVHSFTTGSTVEGPGVRLVAWTTGCQFRCLYCHNPDTWNLTNGIPVTLGQATEKLRSYANGLKQMGGGLTLSGGEPLVQHRFVVRLLSAAKSLGIHTALATNGALGDLLSSAELETIDLVLLDIKGWNPERHVSLTQMDIGPVLNFASRLASLKRPVWLRYVLVPGITDNIGDIRDLAAFASRLGNVKRIEILPFHQMGRFKWEQLKLHYGLADVEPPWPEVVEIVRGEFEKRGLKAC